MQPEALSPRFIATSYGCRLRQTQAAFGLGDFVKDAILMPCGHGALARLLTMPGGEAELPGFFTQFKAHKQRRLGCVTILFVGRCGGHSFLLHGDRLRVMEKKFTCDPLIERGVTSSGRSQEV